MGHAWASGMEGISRRTGDHSACAGVLGEERMSKAYRKWKEDIKAYRRGELPHCQHDYEILLCDTSMAAYRRTRRVKQRGLKQMKKWLDVMARIETMQIPDIEWKVYSNPQQVSEAERIRQADEYGRSHDLH